MILQWVIFIHLALLCYTASTVNPQNNNANALSVFNGDSRALIINRNINKEHKVPLRDERECSHELKHLCPVEEYESDDLSILTCIQYLKVSNLFMLMLSGKYFDGSSVKTVSHVQSMSSQSGVTSL